VGTVANLYTDEVIALATGEPDQRINTTLVRTHRDEIRINGFPENQGMGF